VTTKQKITRPGTPTAAQDSSWEALQRLTTISLRPIGAPVSLGLFGLAGATLAVSGLQLGWIDAAEGKNVALVLIGFAFPAQALASVISFLARDGVAGTALGVLALTWLAFGLIQFRSQPGATSDALGLFLLASASAMALTGTTTTMSKLVVGMVFLTASVRLALGGLYELTSNTGLEDAAGVTGLLLFALALYAAWAGELEEALGKTVLPLGRRGKGKVAVNGSLLEQVAETPTAPGVRVQL